MVRVRVRVRLLYSYTLALLPRFSQYVSHSRTPTDTNVDMGEFTALMEEALALRRKGIAMSGAGHGAAVDPTQHAEL